MNIVLITSILPYPLTSGGAQAQFNMIDKLRHKHKLYVIFPENGKNRKSAMKELHSLWPEVTFYCYPYYKQLLQPSFLFSKIKRAISLRIKSSCKRFLVERTLRPYGFPYSEEFYKFVNNTIKSCAADIVQIDFYPFLHLINQLPVGIPSVFIHHELRYIRNQRLLANVDLTDSECEYMDKVKEQEISDLNKFHVVVTLTDVDKKELQNEGVKTPIYVSPAAINSTVLPYEKWNNRIVFVGGFAHTPNKEGLDWFFSKVVPQIDWEKSSCTGMDVIGSAWPGNYAEMFNMNGLQVKFHGFVPELADVARGAILVIPILSGSGMRMKILEGAAQGMPMITTTVGVEGLTFTSGDSIMVADEPSDFAKVLEDVMHDHTIRKRLTDNARQIFQEQYSAAALAEVRNSVYETVISGNE